MVIREEISVVEDGALAEPTLVTQANVINITDGVIAEGTIREEETIDEGPEETIANILELGNKYLESRLVQHPGQQKM